jgi:hypothetical protein
MNVICPSSYCPLAQAKLLFATKKYDDKSMTIKERKKYNTRTMTHLEGKKRVSHTSQAYIQLARDESNEKIILISYFFFYANKNPETDGTHIMVK